MAVTGKIFEIQHFALYDGPGVRTVIYLKGCPLRCLWCHNPEGQRMETELLFHRDRCTGCGQCAVQCPNGARTEAGGYGVDRTRCTGCGRCAQHCLSNASVLTGKTVCVEEMLREVRGDRPFFGWEGGLTLSGGEPLMQAEFTYALLAAAKEENIHTCMETSGFASEAVMARAAAVTDLFLFDIKELDPARHREMTGVDNGPILANLHLLDRLHKRVILRCPIIPTQNLRPAHFTGIAALGEALSCVEAIDLEPYHPLGLAKYASLDAPPPFSMEEFLDPGVLSPYIAPMREITQKPIRLSNGEQIP